MGGNWEGEEGKVKRRKVGDFYNNRVIGWERGGGGEIRGGVR